MNEQAGHGQNTLVLLSAVTYNMSVSLSYPAGRIFPLDGKYQSLSGIVSVNVY